MENQDLNSPQLYINRELSWLDFNFRVLEEAQDDTNPLLERVKFLAIVANNLDEFFEIRVAGLLQLLKSGANPSRPDGLSPLEQLKKIEVKTRKMVSDQYRCWNEELLPALADEGIYIWESQKLTKSHVDYVTSYWEEQLEPVLTPIVVDPAHPFPSVINKALCIGTLLKSKDTVLMGVSTVPRVLPRLVRLPDIGGEQHFVSLAGIMDLMVDKLFRGYETIASAPFRVTRNSDLYLNEEDADNLLEEIAEQVRSQHLADAVRLEISADAPKPLIDRLQQQFSVGDELTFPTNGPVNLYRFVSLYDLVGRRELKYKPFTPSVTKVTPNPTRFFESIRNKDILLHHPYDSFSPVIEFIKMAANDDDVLVLKQTLYRTGDDSEVAQALIDAAERGKEVTALVELKARGDEAANIEWARRFEDSGVNVIYGIMGLKTHCKLSLLVRRESNKLQRYAHLGTGNYNQTTAKFYTDLGLITSRANITTEVADVFNVLTTHSRETSFKDLLVAPTGLIKGMIYRIEREIEHATAGRPAAIVAKMNGLTDHEIMHTLYRASQAGVEIDLIVRGVCCLRAGLPGISENIRVYSIIDRFLEHSRLYYFANGGQEEVWLGSADWMNRNLRKRVEVVFPVTDDTHKKRIYDEIVGLTLSKSNKIREMQPDGNYLRRSVNNTDSQDKSVQQILIERIETTHQTL